MFLENISEKIELPKGLIIENQNLCTPSSIMFLKKGSIKITVHHTNGKIITLRRIQSGEFFKLSTIGRKSDNISCLSLSPVTVLVIEQEDMFPLMTSHPDIFKQYLTALNKQMDFLVDKVILFSIQNNRQRIAWYFLNQIQSQNNPILTLHMTKTSLLEYLGMSRGSFYREYNSLLKANCLTPLTKYTYFYNLENIEAQLSDY